jgi:hypothetical protein
MPSTHAPKITDALLDRLRNELLVLSRQAGETATADRNLDTFQASSDLSFALDEIATNRPMLAQLAMLLARHDTKASALAALIGEAA